MGKRKCEELSQMPSKRIKLSLDSLPLEVLKMIADRVVERLVLKQKNILSKPLPKWPVWFPYLARIVHHVNLVYTNVETSLFDSNNDGYYALSPMFNVADRLTIRHYHQYTKQIGCEQALSRLNWASSHIICARYLDIHLDWTYRMRKMINLMEHVLKFASGAFRLKQITLIVDTWPGVIAKNRLDSLLLDLAKYAPIRLILSSERGLHKSTREWLSIFGRIDTLTLRYLCPVLSESVKRDVNFITGEMNVSRLCLFRSETDLCPFDFNHNSPTQIVILPS